MESFIIGDKEFVEADEEKFSITAESFLTLTRTYENVCRADKEFNRHMSISMYNYYNIHFCARNAAMHNHTGMTTEDEKNNLPFLLK